MSSVSREFQHLILSGNHQDNTDNTKQLRINLGAATTSTLTTFDINSSAARTIDFPDATTTVVGTDVAQTLTNKTLTTPIISSISNTGTLTLPTSTDTLVGRATTDTLTNKTFGDNLAMGGFKITGLGAPAADTDAATKLYVDNVAQGLDVKDSVILASTDALNDNASITGSITYNNTGGASGRGQITATLAVSDTFTMDGVSIGAAGDGSRILLKNEADTATSPDGARNGIWTTTVSGTSLTLDRATDFDEDAEVTSGAFTFVEQGSTLADSGWVLTTEDPIVIGGASGTVLTFVQFSGAGQVIAGDGLDKAGNTLSVDLKLNGGLVIESTEIAVDLGASSITGTLAVGDGGTGATTLTSGNFLVGAGTSAVTTTKVAPTGAVVGTTDTQTLTNKTLTSAVLTTPEINDTSADHQYVFGVSELAADRTVTLPLLTGNDTFVFEAHTQTLTNKTLTAPIISTISNTGTLTLPTSTDTLVGRATTDTLTNKTLTTPIIDEVHDVNGNEVVIFGSTASAVNEVTVTNAANLGAPVIAASGGDTNINLSLQAKGSGNLILGPFDWPTADGSANQVLKTDGAGNLGFITVAAASENTVSTTDATVTTIATVATATDTAYFIEADVIGRETVDSDEVAGYTVKGTFKNDNGTLTLVGQDKIAMEDTPQWDVNWIVSGTNMVLQVKGAAATSINWKSVHKVISV